MVTAKIIDKETGTASVNSGRFVLCFVKTENGLSETLMGDTSILELAECAGSCLGSVLKHMSAGGEDPEVLEMVARMVFLKKFFSDNQTAPGKHDA